MTASDKTDISALPQMDEREIQFLWNVEWWDGPLTGLLEYRGQKCWFHFHHEDETECDHGGSSHYIYTLYSLEPHQISEAEAWFNSRGHWDRKTEGWIDRDKSIHDESWTSPDLSICKAIGWFIDGSNPDFYGIKVDKDGNVHPST